MRGRIAGLLVLAAGAASGVSAQYPSPNDGFAQRVLGEHNRERELAGVPRLEWSDRLARDAEAWAQRLAYEGWLRHASRTEQGGAGENLWMGSAGRYEPESM